MSILSCLVGRRLDLSEIEWTRRASRVGVPRARTAREHASELGATPTKIRDTDGTRTVECRVTCALCTVAGAGVLYAVWSVTV